MAIAIDAVSSGKTAAGASATLTISHTVSGSNRAIIVGVSANLATAGVTYNGVAMTQAVAQSSGGPRGAIFYLVNPDTGTHDIVITISSAGRIVGGGISFTGVDISSPIGTTNSATGTSTTPSVALTNVPASAFVVDTGGAGNRTWTVDASQVERWNLIEDSNNVTGVGSTEAGAGGTNTMSWTLGSSGEWIMMGVAVLGIPDPLGGSGMLLRGVGVA